jgi:hypothetical protein
MEEEVLLVLIAVLVAIVIVIVIPYLDASMKSNGQLAINFYGSFFGVLISVLLAFAGQAVLQKRQENSQRALEDKKLIKEAIVVLKAIKSEMNHNIDLLNQMVRELPTMTIFYNLQLSTWKSTSITKLDSLKNFAIIKNISRIYYEYEHLSRKVDIQFQLHYGYIRTNPNYEEIRKSIVNPIILHASILAEESKIILEEIDNELTKYQQN